MQNKKRGRTPRPDTWMPIYWGDYLKDTSHLSDAEHGAYLLLMGHYWANGPLPDDDERLWRIARSPSRAVWAKFRRPILVEFFTVKDGHWHHGRIEEEMARAVDVTGARSEAGKNGAAKRWKDHDKAEAKPHGKGTKKAMANAPPDDGKRIGLPSENAWQTQWQNDGQSPSPLEEKGEGTSPSSARASPGKPAANGPELAALGDRVLAILGGDPAREPFGYRPIEDLRSTGASPSLIEETAKAIAARKGWQFKSFPYAMKALSNEVAKALAGEAESAKPPGYDDWPKWRREHHDDYVAWAIGGKTGPAPEASDYEHAKGKPAEKKGP